MKPRNKNERKIVELSNNLKPLTHSQINWAEKNTNECFVVKSRSKFYCLECNHSWKTNETKPKSCPDCGNKLTLLNYTKHTDSKYVAFVSVVEDFQIVRLLLINKYVKRNSLPCFISREVAQYWINSETGKITTVARLINSSFYGESWSYSCLEIRESNYYGYDKYQFFPDKIHPNIQIHSNVLRNGFKGKFYGFSPQTFFSSILKNQVSETLLKTNQISLFTLSMNDSREILKFWNSIKICIRNKYIVNDAVTYLDYLKMIEFLGKDLSSSFYVCPTNLKYSHNQSLKKYNSKIQKIKLIEQAKLLNEQNEQYIEKIAPFKGVSFTHGDISIKVAESVTEIKYMGDNLKHCVYTNEYYEKTDSLIFCGIVQNEIVETIEFSLSQMKVVQSRGYDNQKTDYTDTFIEVLNNNVSAIKSRLRA